MTTLYVLIACEESQAECQAFRDLGHIAYSCDLQPCQKRCHPEWHICGDVIPYLHGKTHFVTQDGFQRSVPRWDIIVSHPPCTYLCKLGAVHLSANANGYIWWDGRLKHVNIDRFKKMRKAKEFFLECLNAQAKYIAVENPLPMAIALLPKPTCYACPSWFGSRFTKKTLYWLKNLPPLMSEITNPNATSLVDSRRGKYRARTDIHLAQALAKQWSEFILNDKSNQV